MNPISKKESPTSTEKSYYAEESGINAFASQSVEMLGDPQTTPPQILKTFLIRIHLS